jgi:hypothetical protein
LKHNGGRPIPCYIAIPPEKEFPARLRYFYGLDAENWFGDAWTKFKFFDTWIPFGLLMIAELDLECAELCFDFRKNPNSSIYARIRGFLFGNEFLDPMKDIIPVKFFDWRYFRETRKFREKDLYLVGPDFEALVNKIRELTPEEKAMTLTPEPGPAEIARGDELLTELEAKAKQDWRPEANRPPRLAVLAQQRLTERGER